MFLNKIQTKQLQLIGLILVFPLIIVACSSRPTIQTITDINWQWSEMAEKEPASQSLVPNPENYTLLLSSDGSLNIKADCNMVQGSYTLDGSALTIELGPSTMAFCGEESLDYLFLGLLGNVESFAVEDGQLILELKDSAGRMNFK